MEIITEYIQNSLKHCVLLVSQDHYGINIQHIYSVVRQFFFSLKTIPTSKFSEFIPPAEVALVCLKFILSFIKFCSLVTKLWLCGF